MSDAAAPPYSQGCALSGVAGRALDLNAASTTAIVVQASSTDAVSSSSSPATKRCRFAMRPTNASGNHPPRSGTWAQSFSPFALIAQSSGSPRG